MAPSAGFSQHTRGILYAEVRSRSASASLLLAACVSLAALVVMLVAVRSWPWGTILVWPTVAVCAFASFGLLMTALACAPLQRLDFDAATRVVRGQVRHWLVWSRPVALEFDSLRTPRVRSFERELQDPLHLVCIESQGQTALLLGGFDDAAEARQWCDRLAALFKAPPLGPPP